MSNHIRKWLNMLFLFYWLTLCQLSCSTLRGIRENARGLNARWSIFKRIISKYDATSVELHITAELLTNPPASTNLRSSSSKHLLTLVLTTICLLLCATVSDTGSKDVATLMEDILHIQETKHDPVSTVYLLLARLYSISADRIP